MRSYHGIFTLWGFKSVYGGIIHPETDGPVFPVEHTGGTWVSGAFLTTSTVLNTWQ